MNSLIHDCQIGFLSQGANMNTFCLSNKLFPASFGTLLMHALDKAVKPRLAVRQVPLTGLHQSKGVQQASTKRPGTSFSNKVQSWTSSRYSPPPPEAMRIYETPLNYLHRYPARSAVHHKVLDPVRTYKPSNSRQKTPER